MNFIGPAFSLEEAGPSFVINLRKGKRLNRGFLDAYGKLLDFLDKVVVVMGVIAIAGMSTVVVAAIVWRYFFDSPLTWSEEMARFLLIFVCFVGAIPMITRGGFGQVESLIAKLSPPKRRVMDIVINIMNVVFTGVSSGLSIYLVFISEAVTQQITPAMQIPMKAIYTFMPFGFVVMFLRESQLLILKIVPQARMDDGGGPT
jgi:C4-dicarboxylate transporter DctQ subunit